MQPGLREEQSTYLRQRGFEVVVGQPPEDEIFPYLTLREVQEFGLSSEMTYHQSPISSTGTAGVAHPSTMDTDELVSLIEGTVAGNMAAEGKVFQTRPGNPIKVYVVDLAWKEVATAVAARYS